MKRFWKIAAFAAILVAVAAVVLLYNRFWAQRDQPAKEPPASTQRGARPIPVDVYVVDYLRLDEGKVTSGTLLPNEEIDVASEVAGKVEAVYFEEGSRVKRGQVLVKINDEDLQAQLQRATFERNMLKDKLDRSRILLKEDAISREAFDQAETDFNMIEADLQLLQVRIDKTQIKAPFDGIVGFRYVSPGSYLQPGAKIAHLADISRLKVEVYIPERYYNPAIKGTQISFTAENDARENRATVYAVDPIVDYLTHNVTMRAMFDNASMRLVPGMLIRVVVGQKSGTTLQVPTEAIMPDADQKMVWVVRDGHAHGNHVITGTRTESMIEITDGLAPGDSVVVTGLMQVKEGSKLLINK